MRKWLLIYVPATFAVWLAPFFIMPVWHFFQTSCKADGEGWEGCFIFGKDVSGTLYDYFIVWAFFGFFVSFALVAGAVALLRLLTHKR